MTRFRPLFLMLTIVAIAVMPLAFPQTGDAYPLNLPGHIDKLANFSAVPGDGAVTLSWDDPVNSNITGYQYRQQESDADYGDWTDIPGSGTTTTSHTVSSLTNGAVYTFQARAYYDSPFNIVTQSDAASATPTVCANGTAVPNPGDNPGLVSDCIVLLAARDTLAGDGTLNWSEDTAISDWQGITVYSTPFGAPERVAGVDFSWHGLTGAIPAELGGLTNLLGLYLRHNQLTGAIPSELGNLTNLRILYLHGNQLTGAIPSELGNLTDLHQLALDHNQLSGAIPDTLGSLTGLKRLYLNDNQLSGDIPTTLGNLTNLEWLFLSNNSFSADTCIPGALSEVPNHDLKRSDPSFCTAPAAPDAPLLAVVDSSTISVTWSAPDDGGKPITDYDVRYRPEDETDWTDHEIDGTETSAIIDGLNLSLSYEVQVRGVNAEGSGEWSPSGNILSAEAACSNGTVVPDPGQNPGLVSDCVILISARDTLAGDGALDWSATVAISDWQGITVSGTPERVTAVNLDDTGLAGTIPAELGNLTNLEDLDLSFNQLSGVIPAELGGLTDLEEFVLTDNQLSGAIPSELGNLTGLRHLNLDYNQLSGAIPHELGDLTDLEEFLLTGNQLSGTIPSELGNLINLVNFNLSDNQLSGAIPGELGSLTDLVWLLLHDNQLSGAIPGELGSLTNLEWLYLDDNQLSGTIPAELGNLTRLQQLGLYDNQLSGAIPAELGSLTKLELLYLANNSFSEDTCLPSALSGVSINDFGDTGLPFCTVPAAPSSFILATTSSSPSTISVIWTAPDDGGTPIADYDVRYKWIDETDWTDHPFTGTGTSTTIAGLTTFLIYELQVRATNVEGPGEWSVSQSILPHSREIQACSDDALIPGAFSKLGLVQDCAVLLVSRDTLAGAKTLDWSKDTAISEWQGITLAGSPSRVTKLNLVNTGLNGSIPPELGNLTSLTQLYLGLNQLSGSIPPELGNLSNLTQLHLGINNISGSIPKELGNLSSLSELYMGVTRLSGSIPKEMGDLTNLTVLILSGNLLSGSIPKELGDLSNLNNLTLNANQFSGGIPKELGNLSNLHQLYLSDNELTGSIPRELGNLSNLGYLWLQSNELTGQIPPELGNLTNLVSIFLKNNSFATSTCIPASLSEVRTNDHAESGIPICGAGSPVLVLRQHANGGWEITHDGPVEVGWIGVEKNDQISSAVVVDGYTVELYEHGSYGGKKLTYVGPRTVTYGDLMAENMNDRFSSYKLYSTP